MSWALLAGRNGSSRTAPDSSTIARALTADEVSTTKITFDPDAAAVASQVLDGDHRSVGADRAIDLIAPFDDHGSRIQQLVEAEVAKLVAFFQPVQVDVSELQAAGIDSYQLEGRTGHWRHRPAASGDPSHKRGLARAELSSQQDKVARPQAPAQLLARTLGLLG